MPHLTTDDGVKLYYEETGRARRSCSCTNSPATSRSWEPQMRYFGRRYRCIAYNARGYPPSDVPDDVAKYSQARARDDIRAVLDALRIDKAHIVGLSMGGFATVHFGFPYPDRALSLVDRRMRLRRRSPTSARSSPPRPRRAAARFEELGMAKAAEAYALGPTRVQFQNKDPRGWREFAAQLAEHSALGSAHDAARRAEPAAVALRPDRRDEEDHGADADHDRRRGLGLPRARHLDEAHDPDRRRWW